MDYTDDKRSEAKVSQNASGDGVKLGDLVKHIDEPDHGFGLVTEVDIEMWGMPQEPAGIKVLWQNPIWQSDDGASIMYQDEVEVVSACR